MPNTNEVGLHDDVRALADGGDKSAGLTLGARGLEMVNHHAVIIKLDALDEGDREQIMDEAAFPIVGSPRWKFREGLGYVVDTVSVDEWRALHRSILRRFKELGIRDSEYEVGFDFARRAAVIAVVDGG